MEREPSSPHDWREWRRLRAWDLTRQGWAPCDIAEALGVSRAAVSPWLATATAAGRDALRSGLRPGPAGKLLPGQRFLIADCLWHGAEAYGFRGDRWTCARVGKVIEEEFGVRYHPGHVSRLLKELGWTPQVPITRAIQRDEAAIQRWREYDWPQVKRIAARANALQNQRKQRVMVSFAPEKRQTWIITFSCGIRAFSKASSVRTAEKARVFTPDDGAAHAVTP
jgi:transposase